MEDEGKHHQDLLNEGRLQAYKIISQPKKAEETLLQHYTKSVDAIANEHVKFWAWFFLRCKTKDATYSSDITYYLESQSVPPAPDSLQNLSWQRELLRVYWSLYVKPPSGSDDFTLKLLNRISLNWTDSTIDQDTCLILLRLAVKRNYHKSFTELWHLARKKLDQNMSVKIFKEAKEKNLALAGVIVKHAAENQKDEGQFVKELLRIRELKATDDFKISDKYGASVKKTFLEIVKSEEKGTTVLLDAVISNFQQEVRHLMTTADKCFNMDKNNVGHILIINNTFATLQGAERIGSAKDVENLEKTFVKLGFKLYRDKSHQDLNKKEMLGLLEDFSTDSAHNNSKCVVVVIMSHGKNGMIITNDNKESLSLHGDVLKLMSNSTEKSTLKKIPKLVIVQACRGDTIETAIDDAAAGGAKVEDRLLRMVFSDLILGFPTLPNHAAFRDKATGSWYINSVCKVFGNPYNVKQFEVRELLDKVAIDMANHEPAKYGDLEDVVQLSEYVVVGMRRKWYLPAF